jgi:hypothetical protein
MSLTELGHYVSRVGHACSLSQSSKIKNDPNGRGLFRIGNKINNLDGEVHSEVAFDYAEQRFWI